MKISARLSRIEQRIAVSRHNRRGDKSEQRLRLLSDDQLEMMCQCIDHETGDFLIDVIAALPDVDAAEVSAGFKLAFPASDFDDLVGAYQRPFTGARAPLLRVSEGKSR